MLRKCCVQFWITSSIADLKQEQPIRHWPYVHMTPEEAVQAAEDLKGEALLPVHIGKFAMPIILGTNRFNESLLPVRIRVTSLISA